MADLIRFALQNFTLTLLVVGLLASAASLLRAPRLWAAPTIVEALLSYFLLFSIGLSYLYNFVVHVFFSEMAARFIGWPDSPFQREVGFASLGFSVIGLLAFRGSSDMRTAAIVGPACFLLGAAGGHILEAVKTGNYAPGNVGVVLYTDILLPLIGFALLWLQHRYSHRGADSPIASAFGHLRAPGRPSEHGAGQPKEPA
jgi:hypothetical protein